MGGEKPLESPSRTECPRRLQASTLLDGIVRLLGRSRKYLLWRAVDEHGAELETPTFPLSLTVVFCTRIVRTCSIDLCVFADRFCRRIRKSKTCGDCCRVGIQVYLCFMLNGVHTTGGQLALSLSQGVCASGLPRVRHRAQCHISWMLTTENCGKSMVLALPTTASDTSPSDPDAMRCQAAHRLFLRSS